MIGHVVKRGLFRFCVAAVVLLLVLMVGLAVAAQDANRQDLPERRLTMAAEYPGIKISPEDDVSMDIIFYNEGRSHEDVAVWISQKPDDWKARLKTYQFAVTALHIPADDDKTISFEADPPEGVQPGEYLFKVQARTPDGFFEASRDIQVTVTADKAETAEKKGVTLTTSYPVIRGPSDAEFEFSVEVESELEEDAVFDLFAKAPDGWEVNFKPAYESKYISSLRLKANQGQTVAVQVKPAPLAKAGKYPVHVRVQSGEAKGEAELNVILTGTYGLEVGTASGLLSLDARQGKTANLSFYVKNTGSAPNQGIEFMSFKPENWTVEFTPEKIDVIEPDDFKQVEMNITPNEEALVGDYSVNVKINGEKVSKNMELRVTVRASSAWGWIGIGIILVVIAGLIGLFRWLGRR